jgi:ubiquinone/menaquinone biosynthesis C-methylase UbiE
MHAKMEDTGLPGAAFDLVTASFVIHECPPHAIRALIAEARRLLRPGGVLMLADNNPRFGSASVGFRVSIFVGSGLLL